MDEAKTECEKFKVTAAWNRKRGKNKNKKEDDE